MTTKSGQSATNVSYSTVLLRTMKRMDTCQLVPSTVVMIGYKAEIGKTWQKGKEKDYFPSGSGQYSSGVEGGGELGKNRRELEMSLTEFVIHF